MAKSASPLRSAALAIPTREVIHHPRFVLALTLWGAALGGGGVLALSSVDIARISMVLGLGALGALAQFLYAALAAMLGALGMGALATLIARFAPPLGQSDPFALPHDESVRPIDPASELGSESLDAPLEALPFAEREEELTSELELETPIEPERADETEPVTAKAVETDTGFDAAFDAEPDAQDEAADDPTQDHAEDQAQDSGLDLAEFTRIMAEETEALERRLSAVDAAKRTDGIENPVPVAAPASGIEKLRSVPPQELSLVQLVERFAAALHEAQDAAPRDMAEAQGRQIKRDSQGEAERERALATALKALDMFVKDGFEAHGEAAKTRALRDASGETDAQDLRAALTKLQNVNGAA